MKRLTAFILILLLSCQCLVQLGIVGYYQLNRDYIASVLCINQDKPELACEGKCYLNKQLTKTDNPDSEQNGASQQQKVEIPSFLVTAYTFVYSQVPAAAQRFLLQQATAPEIRMATAIFHPPQA